MIHESMGLNQAKKYTLISSVEDVMPKPSAIYDRLIISDPSFVMTEGVKKRLVKPGGIVHQIEWRNTKFMMVQSTFTPGN
jgi:hypothetical protein